MADYANIKLERDGAVPRLVLNRPERRNALTHAMMLELEEAFAELRDDQSCRVLVLRGAGGHFCAGALTGVLGWDEAVATGRSAGTAAARYEAAGEAPAASPTPAMPATAAPEEHAPLPMPVGRAFLDFQNDVTTKDLVQAHQEGFESVEHLKRYTTLGMGTDQGKTSNLNALRLMAGLRGIETPAAGTTTFRPPFTPVSIGALAGRSIGHHFRPVRRSPLHEWHLDNAAVMTEAGPWLRPWYYRWAGDSPESAYVEEMRLVRRGVGISDVSSLGKIDVQGPDAAEFLNRVYVNEFARLAVGKARYGVMLNDDATVLDDGTTARFAPTQYFMTTTTAQAAEVMSRLELLLQFAYEPMTLVCREPVCLLGTVGHKENRRDAQKNRRDSFEDEEPPPACQLPPVDTQKPSRNWRTDQRGGGNRGIEAGDGAAAVK
jgi:hypothetical protein